MEPPPTEPRPSGSRGPSIVVLIAFGLSGLAASAFVTNVARFGWSRPGGGMSLDAEITGAFAILCSGLATLFGLAGLWTAAGLWRRLSLIAVFVGLAVVVGVFSTGVCGL